MKTRWQLLIAAGIFLALAVAVSFVTMRVQPESQVAAYQKLLREHGEKLEISEVAPPPVPASQNCADAVQTAFGAFGSGGYQIPNAMQMVAPGKAMAAWLQPDVRGYGDNSKDMTNSWDDFAAEVAAHRPAIELLKEVFSRPKLDFALDYKKNAYLLLPQLAPFKRTAQVLMAATICELHHGDTGAATTNICTLLALVRANHDEPIVISQLVRIAMVAIAESPTWELLQATNATGAQLAWLQASWEQMEFLDSTEKACVMERAFLKAEVEKARADGAEFDRMMGSFGGSSSTPSSFSWSWDFEALGNSLKYSTGKALWRTSWSYTEEQHLMQANQIVLETLRAMKTNSPCLKPPYDAMQAKLSSLGLTNAGAAIFRALKIPDFGDMLGGNWMGSMVSKSIRIEAARRVVVSAIALKRFQLKRGQWPETLGELVPQFLTAVPIDPYDGRLLRYHPNADGTFLLYCVGEDGVDDGGDSSLSAGVSSTSFYWQNNHARDWVWPQPATDAEIKYFYDHPPK